MADKERKTMRSEMWEASPAGHLQYPSLAFSSSFARKGLAEKTFSNWSPIIAWVLPSSKLKKSTMPTMCPPYGVSFDLGNLDIMEIMEIIQSRDFKGETNGSNGLGVHWKKPPFLGVLCGARGAEKLLVLKATNSSCFGNTCVEIARMPWQILRGKPCLSSFGAWQMNEQWPMTSVSLIIDCMWKKRQLQIRSCISGRSNPLKFVDDDWWYDIFVVPKCPHVLSIQAHEGLQFGRAIGSTYFNYACGTFMHVEQRKGWFKDQHL